MKALLIITCLTCVFGHLCIIEPHQRGDMDVSSAGNMACYRPYAECGKMPAGEPTANYIGGSKIDIFFQQNYNHYWVGNPGHLDAHLILQTPVTNSSHFLPLGKAIPDWPANNMATQTNFTIPATLPDIDCPKCVIQVRYVSNNPDEKVSNNPNAIFYQCADIAIKKAATISN
eukprot:TRINITY_DN22527_c0_g1_i1.p1 TRINITY_DN22527_c0_g1~~TRINITY_DN22527_c0_g1_i1.p1  ORF type:complete len:173 (-),score=20.82 TRINITY_DN22527_c0_g1_i1:19-537(-)